MAKEPLSQIRAETENRSDSRRSISPHHLFRGASCPVSCSSERRRSHLSPAHKPTEPRWKLLVEDTESGPPTSIQSRQTLALTHRPLYLERSRLTSATGRYQRANQAVFVFTELLQPLPDLAGREGAGEHPSVPLTARQAEGRGFTCSSPKAASFQWLTSLDRKRTAVSTLLADPSA